jgi:Flp pilus assembly pilin Flp
MRHLKIRNREGQHLIEYALVIALVSAAVIAMSTYVYRSAQTTQRAIEDEFRNE